MSGPKPASAIEWMRSRSGRSAPWDEANEIIAQAMEEGVATRTLIKRLQPVFPNATRDRLEIIARTEMAIAYTMGRILAFRGNRWVMAVQYSAIADGRCSKACLSRDGRILRLDDPNLAVHLPPIHFGCRCTISAIDQFDFEDLAASDPDLEERYFGHLRSPGAPRNLREAMDWSRVEQPRRRPWTESAFATLMLEAGGG